MIGLCSKTYIVRKTKELKPTNTRICAFRLLKKAKDCKLVRRPLQCRRVNEYKFSSKGVSKRHLTAPMTKFRSIWKTRKAQSGFNCSFRVRKNVVFTYTQERRGFSYLYCKRKVLPDGIHTEPLDVNLCPLPLEKGTRRQRSGKGAIRKRFPLQRPRWEKNKPTIRYLYHETYCKPNEQLFSQ